MITKEDIKVGNLLMFDRSKKFEDAHCSLYRVLEIHPKPLPDAEFIIATLQSTDAISEFYRRPFNYYFDNLSIWKAIKTQPDFSDPAFEEMFI